MKYLKIAIFIVVVIIIGLIIYIGFVNSENLNINISNNSNIINTNTSNILGSHANIVQSSNLVNNITNNEVQISIEEQLNYGDKMNISGNMASVTSGNMFFIVENAIKSYIKNISNNNTVALYSQLSQNYIKNNNIDINNIMQYVDNIADTKEYRAVKMNYVQGETYDQYGVYGKLITNSGKNTELYTIVNINTGNFSYAIVPQVNKTYTDLSQLKISVSKEEIKQTEYNKETYQKITYQEIISGIMNDYQKTILYDTQNAYKLLDSEYSKARFKNYDDFFNYAKNNVNKILNMELTRYKEEKKDNYTEYICEDNFGLVYIIKATGLREYKILLDDYTIETEEYKTEYASLENEQKVKENSNKFIKMINNCDYSKIYRLLNSDFKNTYFKTQAELENYLKSNYYTYNFFKDTEISSVDNGVYVCKVNIQDGNTNANTTKTIIIKLGTGTNFEISFSM